MARGLRQALAPLVHSKCGFCTSVSPCWILVALISISRGVSSKNNIAPAFTVYDVDVTSGSGGTGVLCGTRVLW